MRKILYLLSLWKAALMECIYNEEALDKQNCVILLAVLHAAARIKAFQVLLAYVYSLLFADGKRALLKADPRRF